MAQAVELQATELDDPGSNLSVEVFSPLSSVECVKSGFQLSN